MPAGAEFRKRKPPYTREAGEFRLAQSLENSSALPPLSPAGFRSAARARPCKWVRALPPCWAASWGCADRKSTRLNSSHSQISYAVFCLKKKIKRTSEPLRQFDNYYTSNNTASSSCCLSYFY